MRQQTSLLTNARMTCLAQLPDDPETLKRNIAEERRQFLAMVDQAAADREAVITQIKAEAQQQMDALRQRLEV